MAMRLAGQEVHLEGNWTHPEVVHNISLLDSTLQQVESAGSRHLQINCDQIVNLDMRGLELLYIWIHCARLRGVDPVLVNIPDRLRQAMQCLIGLCFTDAAADMQLVAS